MEKKPRFNYTGYGWEGSRYNAELRSSQIAKLIKAELKKRYPTCKFSITSTYHDLSISLLTAPFDAFSEITKEELVERTARRYSTIPSDRGYAQLNEYQLNDLDRESNGLWVNGSKLSEEAWEVMRTAAELANSYNFDDSDSQIDYFHTNFYLNLAIGRWDKNFQKV